MTEIGASIVVTVRNEGKNIGDLLDSIEKNDFSNMETIVVDDMSTDETEDIVKSYGFTVYRRVSCSRGEGRNIGVSLARYDHILFTDGDARVSEHWISGMVNALVDGNDVVIGNTAYTGKKRYMQERVKIFLGDVEVTAPSVNLGYRKDSFLQIGGFDPKFVTAEDIDLNIRAVQAGFKFTVCGSCLVYAKVRDNLISFLRQAYWNGYGRYQLELKHPGITKNTNIRIGHNLFDFLHMVSGGAGYLSARIDYREDRKKN
ncbi:glycosyltransferase [Thermoplasma sp.]|uniref:glycosyltransferase n=1 Tax=Thermoplasma sp. TaxID=1973142 RepID=UPI001271E55A|nr:glycosyltransferase [Thermoplasma sp.]KAA8923001.1 MAG: glycosyltransferase [Thermoplasma sp.]